MKTLLGVLFTATTLLGCGGAEDVDFGSSGGAAGAELGGAAGSTGGTDTGGAAGAGGVAGEGGAGAAGEGGTGGTPTVCSPGETECSGLDVQTCDQDGLGWTTTSTCPYVCSAGACTGECSPGSNQCSGLSVQTCNNQGQWQTTSTCPFVCSGGACTGVCSPGSKKCSGLTPQTCDNNGQWVDGQACSFVCSAGTCTGACTPNTTQCNGSTVQTCGQNGQWQDTQVCPYVCQNAACGGICVPGTTQCSGNTVQTCNGQGQWQSGSPCPFVCSAGACSGVCVPGTVECNGLGTRTCNNQGQWGSTTACPGNVNANPTCSNGVCGWTCQAGFADCTGAPGCEADLASPATCGTCNNTCNSTGGTPTCSNGTCGIVCDNQHANCNGNPGDGCEVTLGTTANCTGCGDLCTAPAHAVGVCTGSGCDYACTGLWDDCNGLPGDGCEKDVSNDSKNCGGCGNNCYGGSCVAGQCQYAVEKVASSPAAINFMALDSTNVYWTTGAGDAGAYKVLKGGGSAISLASNAPNSAVGITTDGLDVFFSGTNPIEIRKVSTSGGPTTQMTASWGPTQFATDGTNLYWTDQTYSPPCYCTTAKTTKVYKMPVGGGPVTVLATIPYASYPEVVVDSVKVYLASHGMYNSGINNYNGYIYAIAKANGNASVIASCGPYPGQTGCMGGFRNAMRKLAVNSTHVFFQADVDSMGRDLYRVPTGGGTVEWVSGDGSFSTKLAADTSYVYLAENSDILRVPVNTGPTQTIATGQVAASDLALDATHVYWKTVGFDPLDYPQWTEHGIMRALK